MKRESHVVTYTTSGCAVSLIMSLHSLTLQQFCDKLQLSCLAKLSFKFTNVLCVIHDTIQTESENSLPFYFLNFLQSRSFNAAPKLCSLHLHPSCHYTVMLLHAPPHFSPTSHPASQPSPSSVRPVLLSGVSMSFSQPKCSPAEPLKSHKTITMSPDSQTAK